MAFSDVFVSLRFPSRVFFQTQTIYHYNTKQLPITTTNYPDTNPPQHSYTGSTMAPANFKNLSIDIPNANTKAKAESMAEPKAPACSPTSPIPVMASMRTSMSLVTASPTEPSAPSAAPSKVSKPEQLFDMIHNYFYNELREQCMQFLRDPPLRKELKARYAELSDALFLGVLYELDTLDAQGDASLDIRRKSLARVVKDLGGFMREKVLEQLAMHRVQDIKYYKMGWMISEPLGTYTPEGFEKRRIVNPLTDKIAYSLSEDI